MPGGFVPAKGSHSCSPSLLGFCHPPTPFILPLQPHHQISPSSASSHFDELSWTFGDFQETHQNTHIILLWNYTGRNESLRHNFRNLKPTWVTEQCQWPNSVTQLSLGETGEMTLMGYRPLRDQAVLALNSRVHCFWYCASKMMAESSYGFLLLLLLFCFILRVEVRAQYILSKYSTTEIYPQSLVGLFVI